MPHVLVTDSLPLLISGNLGESLILSGMPYTWLYPLSLGSQKDICPQHGMVYSGVSMSLFGCFM